MYLSWIMRLAGWGEGWHQVSLTSEPSVLCVGSSRVPQGTLEDIMEMKVKHLWLSG